MIVDIYTYKHICKCKSREVHACITAVSELTTKATNANQNDKMCTTHRTEGFYNSMLARHVVVCYTTLLRAATVPTRRRNSMLEALKSPTTHTTTYSSINPQDLIHGTPNLCGDGDSFMYPPQPDLQYVVAVLEFASLRLSGCHQNRQCEFPMDALQDQHASRCMTRSTKNTDNHI